MNCKKCKYHNSTYHEMIGRTPWNDRCTFEAEMYTNQFGQKCWGDLKECGDVNGKAECRNGILKPKRWWQFWRQHGGAIE